MSKGIGGSARVVMQDENTVVYEYYAYNLNDEEYLNPKHIYDGIELIAIHIIFKIFNLYQSEGAIPEAVGYHV